MSPERSQIDRARDADRKPVEVLSFMGVQPGMTVLDFHAATGYYTEILSRIVGVDGHITAHDGPGALDVLGAQVFERLYGGDRLANTEHIFAQHNELQLAHNSLDAILMALVYHDTYWFDEAVDWGPVDREALLAVLYEALKPGGIVAVVDHYAAAGSDPHASVYAQHRIDPDIVRRDFRAAGFELTAESEILRNSADDYALTIFDAAVYGRTDRFLMRFRRPD